MNSHQWTLDDIPDLSGKRALVTGVTGGLGHHTVLELARKGAEVIMASRNDHKLMHAVEDVRRLLPTATVAPLLLDLADLSSVRRGADEASRYGPLNILVNNAGIMATPQLRTVDGFDLQFGTNHLGHFALTGLLFPQLVASGDARVVTVASQAHRYVRRVPLKDPRVQPRRYQKWIAYGQSKLANLLFAFELERRARKAGVPVASMAAHPGYAATNLMDTGLNMQGTKADGAIIVGASRVLGQQAAVGAMPQLMAATMPLLPGGAYIGPKGFAEMRGFPKVVRASRAARDQRMAAALWEVSEQATGVTFP